MESGLCEIMDELKSKIGPESSVWLYHSSCEYHQDFQSIQADALILCSNEFRQNQRIGKVYCIKCDNNLLLKILLEMDIKIESAIFIRDGCVEGGNYECSNTATYFARLAPILREKSFILTDHGTSEGFFDVPVKAVKRKVPRPYWLLVKHSSPLSRPVLWEVDKCHIPPTSLVIGNIRLQLVHDSIFNFLETLDLAVFFSHKPRGFGFYFELDTRHEIFGWYEDSHHWKNDFFGQYKIKNLDRYIQISRDRNHTFERALEFAFEHKLERIGFIPFGWGRYQKTYEALQSYGRDYPEKILLFHLNKGDYSYFYSLQETIDT